MSKFSLRLTVPSVLRVSRDNTSATRLSGRLLSFDVGRRAFVCFTDPRIGRLRSNRTSNRIFSTPTNINY